MLEGAAIANKSVAHAPSFEDIWLGSLGGCEFLVLAKGLRKKFPDGCPQQHKGVPSKGDLDRLSRSQSLRFD